MRYGAGARITYALLGRCLMGNSVTSGRVCRELKRTKVDHEAVTRAGHILKVRDCEGVHR